MKKRLQFPVLLTILKIYKYRAAAFDGVRSFSGMATGGNRICSVLACTGDTIGTCGERFSSYEPNTTAVFEKISIESEVPTPQTDVAFNAADSTFYPLSLDVSIMPLNVQYYTYEKTNQDNRTTYSLKLNREVTDLYSFAVWGRVAATDGDEATAPIEQCNSATAIKTCITILILSIVFSKSILI